MFDIDQAALKTSADSMKRIADSEDASFGIRFAALQKWLETEAQAVTQEREFLLGTEGLTANEKIKIRTDAEQKLAKIAEDGHATRKAISTKNAEQEKQDIENQFAQLLGAAENAAASASAKATGISDLLFGANDAEYTERLTRLSNQLTSRNLTIEQYQEQKDELDIEFANRELSRQIKLAREVLGIRKNFGQDVSKETQELNELERRLAEQSVKDVQRTEEQKAKIRKDHFDQLASDIEQIGQMVSNSLAAGVELASIGIERQKVAVEELNASQEKAYEAEVNRIKNSQLTEAEKADKLKVLEAERMAQKEANERRQRKLDVERARFQKVQDIANIITTTALAVVKALALGGPFGIAQAVIVGALGAAQLAKAIATPLPKFEHGTASAPGGYAITDEKGAEMYVEPGGKAYLGSNQGPVLRYLKPGTKVIPADEVNQAMNAAMMAETARRLMFISGYQKEKQSETALNEIKEAILLQTDATLREMRKQKRAKPQQNTVDLAWAKYVLEKTFNS